PLQSARTRWPLTRCLKVTAWLALAPWPNGRFPTARSVRATPPGWEGSTGAPSRRLASTARLLRGRGAPFRQRVAWLVPGRPPPSPGGASRATEEGQARELAERAHRRPAFHAVALHPCPGAAITVDGELQREHRGAVGKPGPGARGRIRPGAKLHARGIGHIDHGPRPERARGLGR